MVSLVSKEQLEQNISDDAVAMVVSWPQSALKTTTLGKQPDVYVYL